MIDYDLLEKVFYAPDLHPCLLQYIVQTVNMFSLTHIKDGRDDVCVELLVFGTVNVSVFMLYIF